MMEGNLNEVRQFIESCDNLAENFIMKHRSNGNYICYGGGTALMWYVNFFRICGITPPRCIVDADSTKWGTKQYKITVCGLDEALERFEGCDIVISAPRYVEEIRRMLLTRCAEERIYSFEAAIYYLFIHDIQNYKTYLLSNWDRITSLYDLLEDDKSKETLIAFLKGRTSGDFKYFAKVLVEPQYYQEDIIHLSDSETLVELGSYDGETLLQFLDIVNRRYNRIYCFEPSEENVLKLKEACRLENGHITVFECGAGDKEQTLLFREDPISGASKIVEDENDADYSIRVDSVDHLVDGPVSFIKMDIEGAELSALYGAKHIIQQYKPKLAVCVYHKKEDFLDIAEYLREIVPEYKLYLRHHTYCATDTVLYAVI